MLEGFDVVGRIFGGHVGMIGKAFAVVTVPVDGLEGGSLFP